MTKTVLIIEDDEVLLRLLGEIFAFHQIKTLETTTGAMGICLAQTYLPDLVVCDLRLPDVDGLDVLARFQEDETTASIPVIILTGCSRDELGESISAFPSVVSIIRKPYSVDHLVDTVMAVIKRRNTCSSICCQENSIPDQLTCDNQGKCGQT